MEGTKREVSKPRVHVSGALQESLNFVQYFLLCIFVRREPIFIRFSKENVAEKLIKCFRSRRGSKALAGVRHLLTCWS